MALRSLSTVCRCIKATSGNQNSELRCNPAKVSSAVTGLQTRSKWRLLPKPQLLRERTPYVQGRSPRCPSSNRCDGYIDRRVGIGVCSGSTQERSARITLI